MQNKIKVLILHNYMAPYRFPLFGLISKNKNIDLTVYFMSRSAKNRKWKKLPKLNFKYKVLPKLEISYFGKDLLAYIINYTFPFLFVREKFDVVISAGWLDFASQAAFFLSKFTKTKFIIWSESTINEPSLIRTITLPFVKYLVRNSDACIAISTRSKEYLISLGAKVNKIFIGYSSVDNKLFYRLSRLNSNEIQRIKSSYNIKSKKVVLYVGQFIERKGIEYLISGFKKYINENPDTSLLLVGYGPSEDQLKKMSSDLVNKNIFFVNHVEIDLMPKIYGIADIFVLPSLEETWGLVVNEAMAAGLPVITTDKVGSSIDLVKNGINGFVVKSKSSMQIYLKLKRILSNPGKINSMGSNSSKLINNFSPENQASAFIKSIQSVVFNRWK